MKNENKNKNKIKKESDDRHRFIEALRTHAIYFLFLYEGKKLFSHSEPYLSMALMLL